MRSRRRMVRRARVRWQHTQGIKLSSANLAGRSCRAAAQTEHPAPALPDRMLAEEVVQVGARPAHVPEHVGLDEIWPPEHDGWQPIRPRASADADLHELWERSMFGHPRP